MSLIYIFEDGNIVFDGSTISEEDKKEAIVITERPKKEIQEGMDAILKWDVESQTAWYEYEKPKLSSNEEVENLKRELNTVMEELKLTNDALAELMTILFTEEE